MDFKNEVVDLVASQVDLPKEKIAALIERPKNAKMGDYAFPAFILAKTLHKNPAEIAKNIADNLSSDNFANIQAVGPYVNFAIDHEKLVSSTLKDVLTEKEHYGDQKIGEGNVPIDMSSPNIAKPMSMGHLRSTVIGNSIAKTMEKVGYTPIKINYLGDYGTQFGKLIAAYKHWGNEEDVKKDPIMNLFHYYVKFHQEAEKNPELDNEGREWFKKLEDGDPEAVKLWKWFREVSLKDFKRIYKELGVTFDSYNGEAFFNDKMQPVIDELKEKGLLHESRGAQVVDMGEGENPAIIVKSDGTSIYLTRDLAAAEWRMKEYNFVKMLYVVGNEQAQHFVELKTVLKKMGYDWADEIHHVPFGLITQGAQVYRQTLGNKPLIFGGGSADTSDSESLAGVEFVNGTRPGNQAVVDIAKSQVGNVGGQPYWSWYGFNSRVEWCACFVSWCYNQAGASEPRFSGCQSQGVPWFQSRGQWGARDYENIAPGDAIFFDWDLDGSADHVGIVIGTDGSRVYTVEGNSGDACKIKSYALTYECIKGYGLMNWD